MKIKTTSSLCQFCFFSLLAISIAGSRVSLFAQGSLTPPGPPAATMKTLDQVQPRTAITNLPYTISAAGSYYFVTNLVGIGGITLNADNVTVDLNGFTLGGIPGSASGVFVSGVHSNVCVRNGIIANRSGIGLDASGAVNSQAVDLQVQGNGVGGLSVGAGSLMTRCSVRNNSGNGISTGDNCVVRDCASTGNIGHGINIGNNTLVDDCVAVSNAGLGFLGGAQVRVNHGVATLNSNGGITLGAHANVQGCLCTSNIFDGIAVGANSLVKDCSASRNSSRGIAVGDGSSVSGCIANTNSSIGIRGGDYCLVKDSLVGASGSYGIQMLSYGQISGCRISQSSGYAVDINTGTTVTDCIVSQNTQVGINTQNRCVVRGCHIFGNAADGIRITADCSVINNQSHDNGSTPGVDGLYVTGDRNHIEGNVLRGNGGYGINLGVGSSCVVIKNEAKGNTTGAYAVGTGNDIGPLGSAAAATSPWANIQ